MLQEEYGGSMQLFDLHSMLDEDSPRELDDLVFMHDAESDLQILLGIVLK